MTPEELQKARDFEYCQEYEHCKADAIIERLLEHIDEQTIAANHRYLDLQYICDEQAAQIETLKKLLIEERAERLYKQRSHDHYDDMITDADMAKAREQLAAKYPEAMK